MLPAPSEACGEREKPRRPPGPVLPRLPCPPPAPVPDELAPFISLPFFPPFSRPPTCQTGLPDSPGLAVHQRRELKEALGDPEEGTGAPLKGLEAGRAPAHRQPGKGCGRDPGAHRGRDAAERGDFLFYFFICCKSSWSRGEKNFKFTSGRAPWGSRSNLRAGCLSAAAEKRIAQGPSLSRSWIKLQTQTPPFSTQQTVVANAAIWTLKTHYE